MKFLLVLMINVCLYNTATAENTKLLQKKEEKAEKPKDKPKDEKKKDENTAKKYYDACATIGGC